MSTTENLVGGPRWTEDQRRNLRTNIRAAGDVVALITVTAPGQDVLPWDHSGNRVVEGAAILWNESAQKRWTEMNRNAVQNVARRTGLKSRVGVRVFQLQKRGVLHLHIVTQYETEADKIWTAEYVRELRRLSRRYHYGFVDFRDRAGKTGKPTVMSSKRAAGYLSKYFVESSQIMQAVKLKKRPRRIIYVSTKLTMRTHCTMRRLRRARHLWVHRAGKCPPPMWAANPVELVRVSMLLRRLDNASQSLSAAA